MFSQLVFIALIAFFVAPSDAFIPLAIAAVGTIITGINDMTTLICGTQSVVDMMIGDDSEEKFKNEVIQKLDNIQEICGKVDDIRNQIKDMSVVMQESTERIISNVEFNRAKEIVADFKKNIDYVNNVYKNRFSLVWNKLKKAGSTNSQLKGLVCDCAFDRSLSELYSDISSSIKSQSNIFYAISKYYDEQNGYKYQCGNISPMDDLLVFVGNILAAFVKGYSFLLVIQGYHQRTSDPEDAKFYRDQQNITLINFKETIEGIHQHAKIAFDSLPSNYRSSHACDPSEWIEGKSFIRVKNYVSFQISDNNWITKNATPEEIAESKEVDCPSGYAAYKSASPGAKGTSSMVCTTPFDPHLKNPNSIQYKEMTTTSKRIWESRTCVRGTTTYDAKACAVDHNSDPHLSVRKLSLRLQECDENEVVTDARFQEHGNKIHIRLQCCKFKDGKTDPTTLRWTKDNKPFAAKDYIVLGASLKTFNLDNIPLPKGVLLTGAGFEVVDQHHISLIVKGIEVHNFYSGTTFGERKIYSAPKSKTPRKNIDITNHERPSQTMCQTYEMSKPGESSISLTISKYSSHHNNQAIVPYFDMTPYNEEGSPMPLAGLGVFYKSCENFAGFLALKHLSPIYIHYVDIAATVSSLRGTQTRKKRSSSRQQ